MLYVHVLMWWRVVESGEMEGREGGGEGGRVRHLWHKESAPIRGGI